MSTTRNRVYPKGYRGFESLPLRQDNFLSERPAGLKPRGATHRDLSPRQNHSFPGWFCCKMNLKIMDSITSPLRQPGHPIAIYGPPGAGKSTVIAFAKKIGWHAIDLEDVGSTLEDRKAALFEFTHGDDSNILFGAADIPPEFFPHGTKFVLLAPDEDVLVTRVQARNDRRIHKWIEQAKKVRGEHLQMAKSGAFDFVITEDLSPLETLRKINSGL